MHRSLFASLAAELNNHVQRTPGCQRWKYDLSMRTGWRAGSRSLLAARGVYSRYLPKKEALRGVEGEFLHRIGRTHHLLQASISCYRYQRRHYPNEWRALISYAIPLSLQCTPKQHDANSGELRGYVVDAGGAELSRALVRIDDEIELLTDERGYFQASALSAGAHRVDIEPCHSTQGASSGYEVQILAGDIATSYLAAGGQGTVSGQVIRYGHGEQLEAYTHWLLTGDRSVLCEVGGVKNVRIFLEHEATRQRIDAITNGQGRFYLSALPTGRWLVWIDQNELPDGYLLSEKAAEIDVYSQEEASCCFALYPEYQVPPLE